ncbi:MAG: Kelch repeat-containing protein [Methanoregula sp.]
MKIRYIMLIGISLLLLVPAGSALSGNWTEINSSAEFPIRYQHSSVVYEGSMWVIGGNDGGYLNDTWYSSDGNLWYRANASAEFPSRNWHSSVVQNNRMWVIGGISNGNLKNDTWNSADGILWEQANASAEFPARDAHTSVVFNNKMWVIGGTVAGGGNRNDTWYSTDGIVWAVANSSSGFSSRFGHTSLVFDNKMWVIGGNDGGDNDDVWYSSNGIVWVEANHTAAFPARYSHTSVVYDNKMWVIGGISGGIVKNDVWYSSDGVMWNPATVTLAAPSRQGHTSVVSVSKMWIISGFNVANKNDTWSFQSSPVAGFTASPRSGSTPLSVTFSDTSTGYPSSYSWTFGDGGTASIANPVHIYTAAGTYTVSQTVTNSDGTSTETKAQFITITIPEPVSVGDDVPSSEPPRAHSLMTTTVNVGGDSAMTHATLTGTGLSDLIVTGIVRPEPGVDISPPPGIVYQYVDLVPARYISITGSEIYFSIPVPWLDEHHVSSDNVNMYHYTGTMWEVLPTKVVSTRDSRVYFSAQGSGFSLFAISGKPGESPNGPPSGHPLYASEDTLPNPDNTPETTSSVIAQTTAPLPVFQTQPATGFPYIIVLTTVGCTGLLAGSILVRKWWIQRENPALFREYK